MSGKRARLSLVEYGAPVDLCKEIIAITGLDRARSCQIVLDAGARAADSLGLSYNPITIDSKGVRATDFAGLIRLGPALELEVSPKFLGLDESDDHWREDFFFLANLSRHGRLLARERLSASGNAPRDLSTLVARSITRMYEDLKRRPLRRYRRVRETGFFIDGDPDPLDLVFPSADGFEQETTRFDRNNSWNATILAAARQLLPEVRDPAAVASLVRLIEDLSPQKSSHSKRSMRIPARHRAWVPLYDISVDVLNGLGMNYELGSAHAPGYLVSTWQVWEDLLTLGARLGFGSVAVLPQTGFVLGNRRRASTDDKSTPVTVFPDCVIQSEGNRPQILLDAKYKSNVASGPLRISEADIYEACAFSKATRCMRVILAYPALPSRDQRALGSCSRFEQIDVDGIRIVGVQIETRAISRSGALKLFASAIAQQLPALIA